MNGSPSITRRPSGHAGEWPEHIHPVLARVYWARGIMSPEQAELKLARLLPPDALGHLDAATQLLAQAIREDWHIVIVGDFDCDGATGTAVAVRGLRMLGAQRVSYQVPHRITHGYGLSVALVGEIVGLKPDLLVTVDNGIACHAGIAAAKARGWKVLVTDHHLPGAELPAADVIVNPNLIDDGFPSKALAGVGVMFYLLLALRRRLRESGAFVGDEPDLATLLDLVAIGTVADLVPLDYNNRLLVSAGLKRMRQGRGQAGVHALAEVSGRTVDKLVANDIGFAIGPRLNAAGRLEDMALGIECLLTDDHRRARELAEILDGINAERRGLQQQMVDEAEVLLRHLPASEAQLPAGLCFYDEAWHPGIVGLVASRMKERLHRPVMAFAPAEPASQLLRGSGRSIPGFHIRDALANIDAAHPRLIERFGGHAMAAGLSLQAANLEQFRQAFSDMAQRMIAPELLRAELLSDGPLLPSEFNRSLAEALRTAGPWGQGFPEPLFDNFFMVKQWRVLGERHLKFDLVPEDGVAAISAIHFGGWTGDAPPGRIHALYQLDLDDYRDRRDVQLLVRHWAPA